MMGAVAGVDRRASAVKRWCADRWAPLQKCRSVSIGHADKPSFGASFCTRRTRAERRIGRATDVTFVARGARPPSVASVT